MACRWLLGLCMPLFGLAPLPLQAADTLTWLISDLPPLTFFDGPQKGQGAIDELLPMLIERLPEYEHKVVHVNRARGLQMLQAPALSCDPSLLWTPQRAKWVVYSGPAFSIVSNGVAVRQDRQAALAPLVTQGKIDLTALLQDEQTRLGMVAERSYGTFIDGVMARTDAHYRVLHYGNDALGSLLQMQRLGRLEAVLGYWTEIRYHALRQGIDPLTLAFYPIAGAMPYQRVHIGCSDTPQGHQVIEHLNGVLSKLPQDKLLHAYANWLDPALRAQYLTDPPRFYRDAP
ncbi:TIGR02285 family protein [Pseudomonas sp. EYE_354]|uniref:TIGR02285 family protein n=1 Tax=Pseudomonas sp. EYE_354 TaxID=2853449 RepID=UPI0020040CF7|nr:TIGR02285 family protein [Pseudomonas sp. EYE_354]MCK6188613.1 TIGR02285 family protein [Pseudomonas sp. EYE_354]